MGTVRENSAQSLYIPGICIFRHIERKEMTKKDMKEADLPQAENSSQNSQTANAIRNQSSVRPANYPNNERKAGVMGNSSREKQ